MRLHTVFNFSTMFKLPQRNRCTFSNYFHCLISPQCRLYLGSFCVLPSGGSRLSDGGGGGGHPDPEIGGGGPGLKNKFFQAFGPQFGRKIRGGRGPSLGSATASRYPR